MPGEAAFLRSDDKSNRRSFDFGRPPQRATEAQDDIRSEGRYAGTTPLASIRLMPRRAWWG